MIRTAALLDPADLPEGPWVVATSGGMDSMALLHSLRFGPERPGASPPELVVAHLDHGMRPSSAADARWLAGVCRAWGLRLVSERSAPAPVSEEEARILRYAFLERTRATTGASAILTAHHADDQVETVLFRILRGTGVAGLRGIPSSRGVIHRPMLERSRGDIARYVRRHRVPFRADPSNESRRFTRNRIRHDVLPALEAQGLPQVRRSLLRLARNARRAEAEREALERVAFQSVLRTVGPGRGEWPVDAVADWPPALAGRLLRTAARRLGVTLTSSSTRTGLGAMGSLRPGQGVDLSGGLRLHRGRDRWILRRSPPPVWDEVEVGRDEPRAGVIRLGERRFRFRSSPWREGSATADPDSVLLPTGLPLRLRGWRPGDRIRLPYGSKPVAKLLAERGVPSVDRPSTPVVAGTDGAVLWVSGAAVSIASRLAPGSGRFLLSCVEESRG